jgi:hypothetical protein
VIPVEKWAPDPAGDISSLRLGQRPLRRLHRISDQPLQCPHPFVSVDHHPGLAHPADHHDGHLLAMVGQRAEQLWRRPLPFRKDRQTVARAASECSVHVLKIAMLLSVIILCSSKAPLKWLWAVSASFAVRKYSSNT